MYAQVEEPKVNKSQSIVNGVAQMQSSGVSTFQFIDNRPETIAQRKLQEMGNHSPRALQLKAIQEMANNSSRSKQGAQLQVKADFYPLAQRQTIQKKSISPVKTANDKVALPVASALGGRNVIQGKWEYDSESNLYNQDVELHGFYWSAKLEEGKLFYRTIERSDWTREPEDYDPPDANIDPMNTTIEGGWVLNEESGCYEQETSEEDHEVHWKAKVMNGQIWYHFTAYSEWDTPEEWIEEGMVPPAGVVFQEQRRQAEQDKSGAVKYAFEKEKLAKSTPYQVRGVQRDLLKKLAQVKQLRDEHKTILDLVIKDEFANIETQVDAIVGRIRSDNLTEKDEALIAEFFDERSVKSITEDHRISDGQIEAFKAGLRYKRVYEHEQNLLTINRRARSDYEALIDQANGRFGVQVTSTKVVLKDGWKEEVKATFKGTQYHIGTTFFGDSRFIRLGRKKTMKGKKKVIYKHRESGKHYVKDKFGTFVPRYVKRSIRYEDLKAIRAGESMPTKMDYQAPISGKEATDYGNGFAGGDKISHQQKVIGQIRGYGRFLSATTSNRAATSTSRGTYHSPFGAVSIDLAKMSSEDFTDAHTEEVMSTIFGVEDLGKVEFIGKHIKGESANIKAARDAYRAREIVISSPPPEAVKVIKANDNVTGILIIGLTGGANAATIETVSGKYARNIIFKEINTNYKREEDGFEGRSAFVFYKDQINAEKLLNFVKAKVGEGVDGIEEDALVKLVPTSASAAPDQIKKTHAADKQLKATTAFFDGFFTHLEAAEKVLKGKKRTTAQKLLSIAARNRKLAKKLPAETTDLAQSKQKFEPAALELQNGVADLLDYLTSTEQAKPAIQALTSFSEGRAALTIQLPSKKGRRVLKPMEKARKVSAQKSQLTELYSEMNPILSSMATSLQELNGKLKGKKAKSLDYVIRNNSQLLKSLKAKDPDFKDLPRAKADARKILLSAAGSVIDLVEALNKQEQRNPAVPKLRELVDQADDLRAKI